MTDWIMIAITGVYVIATILICVFNYRSAKATREQVAESKRQFYESNRAFLTVTFELVRSGLAVLHIKNHGNRIAQNVSIKIDPAFLQIVSDQRCKELLDALSKASFVVGIGQSWYCCIGSHLQLTEMAQQLLRIDVSYCDDLGKYHEPIDIKLDEYFWSLIYDSPLEDIYNEIKKEVKSMQRIEKTMEKLLLKQQQFVEAIAEININNGDATDRKTDNTEDIPNTEITEAIND